MCIFGALGNWQQGETAEKIGVYNQALLNQQATRKRQVGAIQATQFLRRGSQLQGRQMAGFAAMGARLDTGTPADVMAKTIDEINYDAQMIRWNTEAEATELINRGNLARYEGESRGYGYNIAGYGSLLNDSVSMFKMFA
jgi:hypothetical protein